MERKACSKPHNSVDSLKATMELEWANMSMDIMRKICYTFRLRLESMLESQGGHFKNLKVVIL